MSLLTKQRYLAHRKVEFNELFFDLIFVYAVSKIAHTILHIHHGTVSFDLFAKYLMMTLVFTTIWSYQTFFTNRFGTLHIRDVGFTMVNMFIVIYLSNSLNPNFDKTFTPFVLCTSLLFFSIALQYTIRHFMSTDLEDKAVCLVFIWTTFIAGLISFIALFVPSHIHYFVFFGAIGIGMLGPLFGYQHLSSSPVNMPHLVERYSLLTIIMFGEVMIGLASVFKITHFDPMTIFQFATVVFLFWTYWIKTERFINHHQVTRGFLLYHAHILIFLSLGMFNAAIIFSEQSSIHTIFKINLMYGSIALYFLGYFINMVYFEKHHQNIRLLVFVYVILCISYGLTLLLHAIPHILILMTCVTLAVILLLIRKQLRLSQPAT